MATCSEIREQVQGIFVDYFKDDEKTRKYTEYLIHSYQYFDFSEEKTLKEIQDKSSDPRKIQRIKNLSQKAIREFLNPKKKDLYQIEEKTETKSEDQIEDEVKKAVMKRTYLKMLDRANQVLTNDEDKAEDFLKGVRITYKRQGHDKENTITMVASCYDHLNVVEIRKLVREILPDMDFYLGLEEKAKDNSKAVVVVEPKTPEEVYEVMVKALEDVFPTAEAAKEYLPNLIQSYENHNYNRELCLSELFDPYPHSEVYRLKNLVTSQLFEKIDLYRQMMKSQQDGVPSAPKDETPKVDSEKQKKIYQETLELCVDYFGGNEDGGQERGKNFLHFTMKKYEEFNFSRTEMYKLLNQEMTTHQLANTIRTQMYRLFYKVLSGLDEYLGRQTQTYNTAYQKPNVTIIYDRSPDSDSEEEEKKEETVQDEENAYLSDEDSSFDSVDDDHEWNTEYPELAVTSSEDEEETKPITRTTSWTYTDTEFYGTQKKPEKKKRKRPVYRTKYPKKEPPKGFDDSVSPFVQLRYKKYLKEQAAKKAAQATAYSYHNSYYNQTPYYSRFGTPTTGNPFQEKTDWEQDRDEYRDFHRNVRVAGCGQHQPLKKLRSLSMLVVGEPSNRSLPPISISIRDLMLFFQKIDKCLEKKFEYLIETDQAVYNALGRKFNGLRLYWERVQILRDHFREMKKFCSEEKWIDKRFDGMLDEVYDHLGEIYDLRKIFNRFQNGFLMKTYKSDSSDELTDYFFIFSPHKWCIFCRSMIFEDGINTTQYDGEKCYDCGMPIYTIKNNTKIRLQEHKGIRCLPVIHCGDLQDHQRPTRKEYQDRWIIPLDAVLDKMAELKKTLLNDVVQGVPSEIADQIISELARVTEGDDFKFEIPLEVIEAEKLKAATEVAEAEQERAKEATPPIYKPSPLAQSVYYPERNESPIIVDGEDEEDMPIPPNFFDKDTPNEAETRFQKDVDRAMKESVVGWQTPSAPPPVEMDEIPLGPPTSRQTVGETIIEEYDPTNMNNDNDLR